ncbi:cysteine dioxygenase [Nocardioides rotundus]|uniref:cysteine dioxygenase n=1 Tax=Nocardioides rotundus TaxID=1774216 RepID=UPI001CBE62ED|nr:cysteine dioxygenase [Nocardioides rotundus]UAL30259.1 cysteine dioxygenase [Nocardioides rotundus]
MTVHPAAPATGTLPGAPGRVLDAQELRAYVRDLAARPELWRHHVAHGSRGAGERHYVSLHRDEHVDVWLLCWNTADDTGWHDHDTSSGAVAVVDGVVLESWPRLGGEAAGRELGSGQEICFGPEYIHRMTGGVDGSVSIHAYSPPLWRMGQYSISEDGVMRRWSVSYADELRPLEDPTP